VSELPSLERRLAHRSVRLVVNTAGGRSFHVKPDELLGATSENSCVESWRPQTPNRPNHPALAIAVPPDSREFMTMASCKLSKARAQTLLTRHIDRANEVIATVGCRRVCIGMTSEQWRRPGAA
jgi:hypothetical protein